MISFASEDALCLLGSGRRQNPPQFGNRLLLVFSQFAQLEQGLHHRADKVETPVCALRRRQTRDYLRRRSARTYSAMGVESNVWCARKEDQEMAFKQGEVYKCPDPKCGCEITVTKGAAPTCHRTQAPRCCCGKDMVKKS